MKSILSHLLSRVVPVIPLLCLSLASRADRVPDPVEFSAGLVAFSELCAARFPQMKDARDRLLRQIENECKVHDPAGSPSGCEMDLAHLRAIPGFNKALESARAQAKALPDEEVSANCESMYSSLPK